MDDPEQWRWVWIGTAVLFGIGEMATPGAFFLAPFALGAVVATGLAFAEVSLAGQWAAFVGISVTAFAALRPMARRLDRDGGSDGVGSRRLIGRAGIVIEDIEPAQSGRVRVDHEEWRADSDDQSALTAGTAIRVSEVEGTRLIVAPTKEHSS